MRVSSREGHRWTSRSPVAKVARGSGRRLVGIAPFILIGQRCCWTRRIERRSPRIVLQSDRFAPLPRRNRNRERLYDRQRQHARWQRQAHPKMHEMTNPRAKGSMVRTRGRATAPPDYRTAVSCTVNPTGPDCPRRSGPGTVAEGHERGAVNIPIMEVLTRASVELPTSRHIVIGLSTHWTSVPWSSTGLNLLVSSMTYPFLGTE